MQQHWASIQSQSKQTTAYRTLLDATLFPPHRWRKKKGVILPPDFFTEEKPTQKESSSPLPKENEKTNTKEEHTTVASERYKPVPTQVAVVEEKPADQPKPPKINITAPEQGKRVSGLSLSSIQKKKEWDKVQKKEVKKEDLPHEGFTQEKLDEAWNDYQSLKSKKGEQNIASLFKISTPILLEDFRIEYSVPNSLNKVELEREFTVFLPFLREKLQNYSLRIDVIINQESEKSFIYTAEEKYERFKEINPVIEKLKKELDLDL